MRILFCNKYNFPFSGTEMYLFELMELLRSHGHQVALFSMADARGHTTAYDQHFAPHIDFKSESAWWRRARQVPQLIYSSNARTKMRAMIREFCPDVAHLRNIYHHLTPSILWELRAEFVPVLYHLNDFKLLCPSYNMVSQGHACERCKGGAFWHVLSSNCYPGVGARIALTAEAYAHGWVQTYQKCVDVFLAPSSFVRDKFVEHGWDASRFRELPHFQRPHDIEPVPSSDAPLLYCGRLSLEKGVDDLLRAMQRLPHLRLVIAGDGPHKRDLEQLAAELNLSNAEFIGAVNRDERDRLIRSSRFTVFPSHAQETLGKTILESYAEGRAVIATDLGSRREFVHDGETGLLYQSGDVPQLARSIRTLADNPELADQMGRAGWELVRQHHSPEEHYCKLYALYEDLVSGKRDLSGKPASAIRTWPWKNIPTPSPIRPNLRVAFIGGRELISKYSGIESYYEEIGARLAETGHEVTVYCRSHFTPALSEYNGMRIVRIPTLRTKHLETLIHTLLSTAHALTQKYDVVHYHALGPALFSWIPRLFGTATTVTVQGLDWQRAKWGKTASTVLQLGERASVLFPNRTMVVSQTLQRHYRQARSVETVFVPNGGVLRELIAPHKILEWGLKPGRYVLFLGRFSPEKGCHVLIEAFEGIETDVKLVLAGGASYCDAYIRDVLSHASDRIRIFSWVSGQDLDELLTNAMLFVLPSEMEGLSLALLDAMGAGICVLASDIAENCEAVEGVGFTFRCGNVADLRDRLRFLIDNAVIREAAGKAARKRVEDHYNWSKLAKDVERVYYDVLGLQAPEPAQKKPKQPSIVGEPESKERLVG